MDYIKNLVSIIIPVYNVEEYLDKCLESIINQTYKNIEVILIDDGSTDKSGEICDIYSEKDERIKVIHQKNGGVCRARNAGLKSFKGEYVMFVDPDDYIDYDCIEVCLSSMIDDIDLVCFSYITEYQNRSVYRKISGDKVFSIDNNFNLCSEYYMGTVWGALYRAGVLENLYFDSALYFGEDSLFICQAMLNCRKIKFINKYFYHCVYRKNSASNGQFSEKKYTLVYAMKKIYDLFSDYPHIRETWYALNCIYCLDLCIKMAMSGINDDRKKMLKKTYLKHYKSIFLYFDNLTYKDRIKYGMFGICFSLSEKIWVLREKLRK